MRPVSPVNSMCPYFTNVIHYIDTKIAVIVSLHNLSSNKILPREVWVRESDSVPLSFSDIGNNEFAATVRLSQLLPTVLANNSPIKGVVFLVPILCVMYTLGSRIDMGGCIYREGKSSKASRVQLGTVAAIASGELPHQLRMDGLDKFGLYSNDDGTYECELFWDGMPAPIQSEDNVRIFTFIIVTPNVSIYVGPPHQSCSRLARW